MSDHRGRPVRAPFFWNEMTTFDFEGLSPEDAVAILPLASTEQHGPHLPLATDAAIAAGMLQELRAGLPEHLRVLVLPVQEIGKANEHKYGLGTLSLPAGLLIEAWTAVGEKVAETGLRKIVLVNSHGGNVDLMNIVARELRVRHGMVAVTTQWSRFGTPDGLYDARENTFGIHGGDVETSLMLHFRPDLVRMEKARDFGSASEKMAKEYRHIRPAGLHGLAWIARDLNPLGVVGDASKATAEKGAATAHHQVAGFIELLEDVVRFPLARLYAE
ncbi:creatininase family protein [Chelativorans xinjiangense]|uniref:creatininase family protein n=1 Tax=Chelativorans xinjiangense TaxID=2681485 RepID=UPI001357F5B0|nr:creatininase family protein [Chelativorans xinjiangense]